MKASAASRWAGVCLLGLACLAVADGFVHALPRWPTVALGWIALALLSPRLQGGQRLQFLALAGGGAVAAGLAWSRGYAPAPLHLLGANTDLLALLVGVSFLRLVSRPDEVGGKPGRQGRGAFIQTLLGTHLFSAVINLSALFIVAERQLGNAAGRRIVLAPLSRAFGAAAFWSPFFAAMGVALNYAPGAQVGVLLAQGLPLAGLALAWTVWQFSRSDPRQLREYRGYPLHPRALWLPASLVAGVLLLHLWLPAVSIILLVAGLSMALSAVVLLMRGPGQALRELGGHVVRGLPRMAGELALFLAAGVFAVGLGGVFAAYAHRFDLPGFALWMALLVFAAMVLASVIGIHPVISISVVGVWLAPLHLSGNFLGTVFLSVWAIGVVADPLSGMNLALAGRFGLRAGDIVRWHLGYALFMLPASMPLFALYYWLWQGRA